MRNRTFLAETAVGMRLAGLSERAPRRRRVREDRTGDRTVCKVAIFCDGKLCMGVRNDNGKWTIPGGHADDGETPVETAIREVYEETGIQLQPGDLEYLDTREVKRDDGTITVHGYKAEVPDIQTDTTSDPDAEVTDWKWIDVSEGLPDEMTGKMHVPPAEDVVMLSLGLAPEADTPLAAEAFTSEFARISGQGAAPTRVEDAEATRFASEFRRISLGESAGFDDLPYWEASWTKIEGVDVLQVPGSDFFAIPATGKKNAARFVISNSSREELTQVTKGEVFQYLAGRAREEGVKPTGHERFKRLESLENVFPRDQLKLFGEMRGHGDWITVKGGHASRADAADIVAAVEKKWGADLKAGKMSADEIGNVVHNWAIMIFAQDEADAGVDLADMPDLAASAQQARATLLAKYAPKTEDDQTAPAAPADPAAEPQAEGEDLDQTAAEIASEPPCNPKTFTRVSKRLYKAIDDLRAQAADVGHDHIVTAADGMEDAYWEIQKAIARASSGRGVAEDVEGFVSEMLDEMGKAQAVVESDMRHCLFYKAKDGKWYMELAQYGGNGDEDDDDYEAEGPIDTYGPFASQDEAIKYLDDNFSNPGGWATDSSGRRPAPKSTAKRRR